MYSFIEVPEHASDMVRRFIEALFITHTQTKLNSLGHLDQLDRSNEEMKSDENKEWCQHLICRSP